MEVPGPHVIVGLRTLARQGSAVRLRIGGLQQACIDGTTTAPKMSCRFHQAAEAQQDPNPAV